MANNCKDPIARHLILKPPIVVRDLFNYAIYLGIDITKPDYY